MNGTMISQPMISPANAGHLATSDQNPASSRKVLGLLFILSTLIIFYETAIPFRVDLTRAGLQQRWDRSELIPFLDNDGSWLSGADALGNVLLFVPFGFFLHLWRRQRRPVIATAFPTVLAGALYSVMVESLQLCLDYRTTSMNDLITNTAGTYVGLRLASRFPGFVESAWKATRRITHRRPALVLWLATLSVQILVALAPYDFSLQRENFQRQVLRWQYSQQTLFSSEPSPAPNWLARLQRFPHHDYLLANLLTAMTCSVVLGCLWVFCCRQYGASSVRMIWGTSLLTLGFYPALALLQFMVQSIRPFVLFPIIGLGGVMAGALLMLFILRVTAILLTPRSG